jgi:hypothetical protein
LERLASVWRLLKPILGALGVHLAMPRAMPRAPKAGSGSRRSCRHLGDRQPSLTELFDDPDGSVKDRETAVDPVGQLTGFGELLDPQIAVNLNETSGRFVEGVLVLGLLRDPELVELEVEPSLTTSGQRGLRL